jgi:hypothetical protein
MQPDNNELDEMSEKLRKAVVSTLNLDEKEKVFVGNEEKMFLYGLFQHMPSSSHKTTVKIQNYKELTYHRMMDMWSGEIAKRPEIKKNQPLSEKPRHLIITIRGLLIKIKHLVFLKSKLLHANTMIHYAAHLRYGSFVIPELTSLYFKHKERKDKNLRKAFSVNLTGVGFDPILVEYLTSLFPTSHLESYLKLSAHSIANIKMDTVVTSLSGVLDDPLLSFLIKNNNSKLIYVQHGGGYGLNKNHLGHQIEDSGADIMYYWGTGDNNVYPTRYRNKYFSKISRRVVIVLSDKKDENTIKPYTQLAEMVTNEWQIPCVVVAHPNGPRFTCKNIQYGIGYKQHEKAQLVIYDNISQSLIYPRILSRRPFLILDSGVNKLQLQSDNACKFISLLREAEILIPPSKLEQKINYWMQFSPREIQHKFNKIAFFVFGHVLNQPKIQDIFDI